MIEVNTSGLQMILNDFELRIAELEKLVKHPPLHIDENGNLSKGYSTGNAEIMRVIDIAEKALKAALKKNKYDIPADEVTDALIAILKLKEKQNDKH